MTGYTVRAFRRESDQDVTSWRRLIAKSDNRTIFHDPDFLAYHGDRFDEHHLGFFKGDELSAVLPLALEKQDGILTARSPYGASYGGFITGDVPRFAEAKALIEMTVQYLSGTGVRRISVTPPLRSYGSSHSDTLEFALLHCGFRRTNADISSVAPLGEARLDTGLTASARRHVRKAELAGIECSAAGDIDDFWPLLEATLAKHSVSPTHSKNEWRLLLERFPDRIWMEIAYLDGRPAAGLGMMQLNARVVLAFYICSEPTLQHLQPLSMLIDRSMRAAEHRGTILYDFGTSSRHMIPSETLFRFKESFGALGVFRNSYTLDLAS